MKKTLNGMAAYAKLRTAELPEKTESYTPIPHANVIMKIKEQIIKSGFIISGENYNCSGDGKIGVGSFGIVFQEDPDITLGLNFLNSYNKTYAFRLAMGGQIKGTNIPFLLNDASLGHFKRLHTGAADLLSSDKISEMIINADNVWKTLHLQKDILKQTPLVNTEALGTMMKLFLGDKLTTFQMNYVKKEVKEMFDNTCGTVNGWDFYKILLLAVSEAHPTTWINDMIHVHGEILKLAGIQVEEETIPSQPVPPKPKNFNPNQMDLEDLIKELAEVTASIVVEDEESEGVITHMTGNKEDAGEFNWDEFETDDYLDDITVLSPVVSKEEEDEIPIY